MNGSIIWSYVGISLSVMALIGLPLWWMVASYKRRQKIK